MSFYILSVLNCIFIVYCINDCLSKLTNEDSKNEWISKNYEINSDFATAGNGLRANYFSSILLESKNAILTNSVFIL
jgi:hypothetical protein